MTLEVNFNSPINSLGYGIASTYLLNALSKTTKVNLFSIGPIEVTNQLINQALENVKTADFTAPTVKIWHQHDLISRVGRGKYYAFPFFELDNFTDVEKINLRCPDEFIVASEWAKNILQNFVEQPVNVVPLGVDTDIFYPSQNENGPYRFFNVSKWEIRKGHDILIECFNRAFSEDDDVELHLMCNNPFLQGQLAHKMYEWEALCKTSKLSDKIILHDRVNAHEDVANFIRQMDCGVFPSKAEGWNLELLESMACGKPVIATNYSAHTEFCNTSNSFLVDIDRLEPALDGIWFHGQGNWAFLGEKQKRQIIEYMQDCYENRPDNKLGVETAKRFSWDNSTEGWLNVIR